MLGNDKIVKGFWEVIREEATKGVRQVRAIKVTGNDVLATNENVAIEAPVDVYINNKYWNSGSLTPCDFKIYAIGLLFSAMIITSVDQIEKIECNKTHNRNKVFVTLADTPEMNNLVPKISSGFSLRKSDTDIGDIYKSLNDNLEIPRESIF